MRCENIDKIIYVVLLDTIKTNTIFKIIDRKKRCSSMQTQSVIEKQFIDN